MISLNSMYGFPQWFTIRLLRQGIIIPLTQDAFMLLSSLRALCSEFGSKQIVFLQIQTGKPQYLSFLWFEKWLDRKKCKKDYGYLTIMFWSLNYIGAQMVKRKHLNSHLILMAVSGETEILTAIIRLPIMHALVQVDGEKTVEP